MLIGTQMQGLLILSCLMVITGCATVESGRNPGSVTVAGIKSIRDFDVLPGNAAKENAAAL
jgi:hypothetical protein